MDKHKSEEMPTLVDKKDVENYEAGVYCVICGAKYSTPHKKGCKFYAEYNKFEIR